MPTAKAALRHALLDARLAQEPETALRGGAAIQRRLLELARKRQARTVLAYMAAKGEAETRQFIEGLWEMGARVYLPRCRPDAPGEVDLLCLGCFTELAPGAFGIPEPDPGRCAPLEDHADMVVVPGVGFDRAGRRLGYGGGYYDRLLARPRFARALRVAPAFDFQIVPAVPADPWDQPMHLLVTPSEVIPCASTPA